MFQHQPDKFKKSSPKISIEAALKRDAQRLSDEADMLRQAEIDKIYEILVQEPERWDGLS